MAWQTSLQSTGQRMALQVPTGSLSFPYINMYSTLNSGKVPTVVIETFNSSVAAIFVTIALKKYPISSGNLLFSFASYN